MGGSKANLYPENSRGPQHGPRGCGGQAAYSPRSSVIFCPDTDKLVQVVRPQDGRVPSQVLKVVHDDSHEQVEHLGGKRGEKKSLGSSKAETQAPRHTDNSTVCEADGPHKSPMDPAEVPSLRFLGQALRSANSTVLVFCATSYLPSTLRLHFPFVIGSIYIIVIIAAEGAAHDNSLKG